MYKPNFQKREVLVFRQFQRKGYSLFACLGREVVISVLSVATLSSTKAANISDEVWRTKDSVQVAKEVWLGDVGVTGSRAPLTNSQAARMVTVLSREDIAQAPVQSVNDLLKYAVGVDVRQRGALGSQTDVSIRGGTQEQIVVLLNGINICDPQTAHNVMDLPVQLSEIVRVEVLEGPAGRAYGTSSLVGAINIVTGQGSAATGAGGELTLEGGSFGYAKASLVTNCHPSTTTRHSLSGSYQRSDGYSRSKASTLNTDYSGSKLFYQGQYDGEAVRVNWYMGVADKGWGSGTFYASPRWQADDQYEHTTKFFTALQAQTRQGPVRLQPAIYWQQHRDRYEGYRDRPDLLPYNYNRCDVYGLKLDSWLDWAAGRTAIGAELRNEDLVSGNLGEPLVRPHAIKGTDRSYTLGVNRTNISAHVEQNILLEHFTLSAGFVATKNTWSTMNLTIYPGIDVSYTIPLRAGTRPLRAGTGPAPTTRRSLPQGGAGGGFRSLPQGGAGGGLKLFAGWNTSLRLPSFTEMYYKLQGYAADPHLKPEEMQAVEMGVQYLSPAVQAKATLYRHFGRNMIDWVMDTRQGDQAQWQSVNHTKVNSFGVETQLTVTLPSPLTRLPLPTTLQLSYSYINQDKELEPGLVSQYALEYLRHKLVATCQMPLWRQLGLRLGVRWQDRVGSYTDFTGQVNDYRPFALADARIQWAAKGYTLYAEVNNLFNNHSYVDYGNVPQPGLWVVCGLRITPP